MGEPQTRPIGVVGDHPSKAVQRYGYKDSLTGARWWSRSRAHGVVYWKPITKRENNAWNGTMKLYNVNGSPNCLRVRAVAVELGLELELINIDLRGGQARSPDTLELNANGKVPILQDGQLVIAESRAINNYLCRVTSHSTLLPDSPAELAEVEQWVFWHAVHLGPQMQQVIFERVLRERLGMGKPDDERIQSSLSQVTKLLGVFEKHLTEREWVSNRLSVADYNLASTFLFPAEAKLEIERFPAVDRWLASVTARPAWQQAIGPLYREISP